MTKYHGPLIDEKRDKPRLDSVKELVAIIMTCYGSDWRTVCWLHTTLALRFDHPCREDTVRRMLNYLMKEGTPTHTFHSKQSESNPGTSVYTARRKP